MDDFETGYLDNLDLEIDDDTSASIKEAAKWAKFISTVMFCLCGLMLLIILLIGTLSENYMNDFNTSLQQYGSLFQASNAAFVIGIFIVAIVILFTIYYFLLNFSRKVKVAVIAESTDELNKGLNSLKIYFIIYAALGILSISTSAFSLLKLF